jgi:hypothetical protein
MSHVRIYRASRARSPAADGVMRRSLRIFRVSACLKACGAALPNGSEEIADVAMGIVRKYMHLPQVEGQGN